MQKRDNLKLLAAFAPAIVLSLAIGVVMNSLFGWGPGVFSTVIGVLFSVFGLLSSDAGETTVINEEVITKEVHQGIPDGGVDWHDLSEREIAKRLRDSLDWRRVEDSAYENYRGLSKFLAKISDSLKSRSVVDENQIKYAMMVTAGLGGVLLLASFGEIMSSTAFSSGIYDTLAFIIPGDRGLKFAIPSMIVSLVLLFAPVGYLSMKDRTTCPDCGSTFALSSGGRYYRNEKDIRESGAKTMIDGYRIVECTECEFIDIQQTSWEDS